MAESSTTFKSKYLALKLEQSGAVKAEVPGGLVLNTDVETVKKAALGVSTAATAAVAVAGLENCLKVGLAGTAIAVAAGAIYKKWPWMKTVNVKENNVLEIEVAEAKEDAFDDLVKRDKIRAHLEDSFEDLDSNLDGILGDEVCKRVGQEIIKQLEGVQISSVTSLSCSDSVGVGRRYKNANVTETLNDHIEVVKGQNATGLEVEGGTYTGNITGGVSAVGEIGSEQLDAINRLAKTMKSGELSNDPDSILIRVTGDCLKKGVFSDRFKPSHLLDDVRNALKKVEGKKFTLRKAGSSTALDGYKTLHQLDINNDAVLQAVE